MADELPEVERIVEASIAGTHAFQVRVHLESGEGDAACFASGGLSEDELAGLVSAHEALAAGDESAAEMLLAAGLALDERLPVSVVTAVLSKRCPDAEPGIIRAWANVVQTALEVERDGEIVQDLLGLYAKLGILATADEIGLDDEDAFFLVLGREMSDASCAAPFGTSPGEFQIALRKAANWAVKFRGIEGPADYAEEISRWPDVAACLGAIREMRPARIHIVGHSFSMSAHWAAQASFTDTALELMMRENSGIERRWLGEGGMRATRAREAYFDDAVAWGPDIVIFVVALTEDDHYAALEEMASELTARGARAVYFDRLHPDAGHWANPDPGRLGGISSRSGLEVLEVGALLDAHPERGDFVSLDGIHCRGSYHRFMAAELVKYLAGARGAGPG